MRSQAFRLPSTDAGTPRSALDGPSPFWEVDDFHPAHLPQLRLLSAEDAKIVRRFRDDVIPPGWPEYEHRFPHEEVLSYNRLFLENPAVNEDAVVQDWLYRRQIRFSRRVFLLHDGQNVLQTTWRLIIRYWKFFDRHCGFCSHVIDHTKSWALCFHHENFMIFGSRNPHQVRAPEPHDR